jgi:Protein of unknown function (DUF551)
MNWIKCSERMPELHEKVLIAWVENDAIEFGYTRMVEWKYNKPEITWHTHDGGSLHEKQDIPTHWMPLPSSPKENE